VIRDRTGIIKGNSKLMHLPDKKQADTWSANILKTAKNLFVAFVRFLGDLYP